MGFFSKKKEVEEKEISKIPELPDLPELPELPDLPYQKKSDRKQEDKEEPLSRIPDFSDMDILPDVPMGLPQIESSPYMEEKPMENTLYPMLPQKPGLKFEQGIKKAVESPQNQSYRSSYPSTPSNYAINQEFEPSQFTPNQRRAIEITPSYRKQEVTKKLEPVYIRLDKFQMTVQTFEEIKAKIEEIELLLKKTKEIKQKEEQELGEWEREMQVLKSRIDLIDHNIFSRLD